MALIFWLSSRPDLPRVPGLDLLEVGDKIKHVAAYAVLAALIWRALGRGGSSRRRFWLAVAISILYGLTDEFHQRFVPNRCCDICDLIADALGALAAAAIVSRRGGSLSPPAPKGGSSIATQKARRESL
jgi:VanZ family protein